MTAGTHSRRTIAIALVAALLAVLAPLLALSPASATVVDGSSASVAKMRCTPVVFIGARGSGQAVKDSEAGLGPQVFSISNAVQAALPAALKKGGMTRVALYYPARSVDVLVPTLGDLRLTKAKTIESYRAKRMKPFADSILDGVTKFKDSLLRVAKRCPKARIVVAGYSQGAMVLHQAIYSIWTNKPNAGNLIRIKAGVLLADGFKNANSRTVLAGGAPASGYGIGKKALNGNVLDLPLADRFETVCARNDLVCDGSNVLSAAWGKLPNAKAAVKVFKDAAATHTGYSGSTLSSAGTWAAQQARKN